MMSKFFVTLLKTKRLGRYCKAGAWSILGLGTLYLILYAIYMWNVYQQARNENGLSGPSGFNYFYLFPSIATICQVAMFAIFGFTVLYVAGAIFTSLATSLAPTQDETEDIVYESIDEPIKAQKR